MSNSPYDVLNRAMSKLADKVAQMIEVREATVKSSSPLTILFDTDSEPTPAYSSLVHGLQPGDRVLTLKLRLYVWVLGKKGGMNTKWAPLVLDSSMETYLGNAPMYRYHNGDLELKGAVKPRSGGFTSSYMPVVVVPPGYDHPYDSVRLLASGGGTAPGRCYISAANELMVAATGGSATYFILNSIFRK